MVGSKKRMGWRTAVVGVVLLGLMSSSSESANADEGLVGGVSDLINGVVALPLDTLAGTLSGPPVFGTVNGVLRGAFRTLGFATRGVLRLVGIAIPLAARAAPLIPIFL